MSKFGRPYRYLSRKRYLFIDSHHSVDVRYPNQLVGGNIYFIVIHDKTLLFRSPLQLIANTGLRRHCLEFLGEYCAN